MSADSLADSLADRLDDALPQTQCRRCGYADCRAYAQAIAQGDAAINRCPPGGAEGIARLGRISGRPLLALDPDYGVEGPLRLALIDEDACIGCTLCIQACPVDAILGAAKWMHTVIGAQCTGCELCVPACPVDCIAMIDASSPRTGWAAWSTAQADAARARYAARIARLEREQAQDAARLATAARFAIALETERTGAAAPALPSAQALVQAALERARRAREQAQQ